MAEFILVYWEYMKQFGKSLFYSIQQNELPALKKEFPEFKEVHSQVLQDCLQRLDNAFQRFFRKEAGYLITSRKTGTFRLLIRNRVR